MWIQEHVNYQISDTEYILKTSKTYIEEEVIKLIHKYRIEMGIQGDCSQGFNENSCKEDLSKMDVH